MPVLLHDFGYDHSSKCFKAMDAETGMVVYSRDISWHQSWEPLIYTAQLSERDRRTHRPAWAANQLVNRKAIDEAVQEHGLPGIQFDLPATYASDLSAPLTVAEAEASDHAGI